MATRGKKYVKIAKGKNVNEVTLSEAIKEVKKQSYSTFTGTVEMHLVINLPKDKDPKSIKGSISLPHSAGKTKTVYVFTSAENVAKAEKAGADKVGLEELIKEVQSGKIGFDIAIATPDIMAKLAVLGKELGPKGLMPNPKTGTVSKAEDLEETIKAFKKGKQTFAADAQGGVHMNVGKLDMEDSMIVENITKSIEAICDVFGKSANSLIKGSYLAPTMGTSIKFKLDSSEIE